MQDSELQNLYATYKSSVDGYVSFFSISALGAACRSIISEDRRSLKGWTRGFVLALFAAYVAGNVLESYKLDPGTYRAIVAVSGFVADDVLVAILKAVRAFINEPRETITVVFDAILKRKPQ